MSKTSKIILALGLPFGLLILTFVLYGVINLVFTLGDTGQTLLSLFIFIMGSIAVLAIFGGVAIALIVGLSVDEPQEDKLTQEEKAELSKGWNWGAFTLTWIWGVSHGVKKSLWALIPVLNIVVAFILGAKGNKWALESRNWDSAQEFKVTQSKWAKWGIIIFILLIVFSVLS